MSIKGVKFNQLQIGEPEEADYDLGDTNSFLSTHANAIPLASAVQGPRIFYGHRFFEQALPLLHNEAPLVRNLENTSGRSFDFVLGEAVGARRSKVDGVVSKITPDEIHLKDAEGKSHVQELYNLFPGNRKTLQHNTPAVQLGQKVAAGDLLATSNFTDKEGRMAMGRNAVIALVPYKGSSMDDALVISQSFANRTTSDHAETVEQEKDDSLKLGKNHFVSLFPKKFKQGQLDNLDDEGVVKVGAILMPGDPLILQTRPRSFSSGNQNVSRLSRSQRFVRKDASKAWDGDDPAEVLDVARTRDGGVKIFVRYQSPTRPGDKLVLRAGNKQTVSKIIPDDQMPRTESGVPVDAMLNQLGLPSRENASSFYEMLLGKVAAKTGKPYTLPAFLPPGQTWGQFVEDELKKNGVEASERIYDPAEDRWLDNPVTVGVAHVLKLHHMAAKKMSSRGQSGYSMDYQPLKGGGGAGGAQRLSGLEMNVLFSSGAQGVQKEAVLLRGEKRDEYWRQLRANRARPDLGKPFVWDKFMALLAGSGVNAKDLGHGRLRLVPMTDHELEARESVKIQNDGIVDLASLEPKPGGLFDPTLVRNGSWGHIDLPFKLVNPAYEDTVKTLLGLTGKEYEELLDR
ncbi:MAG: hypothetical protein E6R03_08275 [Hyphomicrobiaceae bacterium]|nr:MAG: hypothetical protein E6R03_08275 [Hyphomicrobiaceae bacterium]